MKKHGDDLATLVCFHCAEEITTGRYVVTNPSNFHRSLGIKPRLFHPRCYTDAERDAAAELKQGGSRGA